MAFGRAEPDKAKHLEAVRVSGGATRTDDSPKAAEGGVLRGAKRRAESVGEAGAS
jgi:hypothetical protein